MGCRDIGIVSDARSKTQSLLFFTDAVMLIPKRLQLGVGLIRLLQRIRPEISSGRKWFSLHHVKDCPAQSMGQDREGFSFSAFLG